MSYFQQKYYKIVSCNSKYNIMKFKHYFFIILVFSLVFFTCQPDDEQVQVAPPRDRVEQQLDDIDTLQVYFNTHYYNSGAIDALSSYPTIADIQISKLNDGETLPPDTTLLIDVVEEKQTVFRDTDYTYYTLTLNEGAGENPHFSDQVRVNYEGFLTTGATFDASVTSVDIDLPSAIAGWNRILPQFKTANQYTTNSDGTVSFENYGIGMMFLPSGLAYFNNAVAGIPTYSCLIFKFELQQYKVMDHDNDYIPSYMEDIDDDLDVFSDNTDGDNLSNYIDSDDDGDGYSTYREVYSTELTAGSLEDLEAQTLAFEPLDSDQFFTPVKLGDDGTYSTKLITLEDSNANGIPNYLDAEDTGTLDN